MMIKLTCISLQLLKMNTFIKESNEMHEFEVLT